MTEVMKAAIGETAGRLTSRKFWLSLLYLGAAFTYLWGYTESCLDREVVPDFFGACWPLLVIGGLVLGYNVVNMMAGRLPKGGA